MASRSKKFSYRTGEQGPRPSAGNQAEVEKSITGTNSSHHAPEDFHTDHAPQSGPHVAPSHNSSKPSRQKWSREEYKGVMEAFYKLLPLLLKAPTHLWCVNNPTKKLNLNVNKLANVCRDMVSRERLTKMKLPAIQLSVKQRVENTTPYTRDANAVPEEQNKNNNQEIDKNSESDVQEPLSLDTQDETVGIIKESILQRYEIAKETPISQRPPIPKIKNERHAKSAIETANKAILSRQPDLSQTSTILCICSTVKESLGIKTKRNNKLRKPNQGNQNGKRKLKVKYQGSGMTYLR